MNDIDDKIRQALSAEDQKLINEISDDPSLFELISLSFKSKLKYYIMLVWLVQGFIFSFAIYSAFQYFDSQEVLERITWATVFLLSIIVVSFAKIWYWLELSKIDIKRDIKRLELRILNNK